MGKNPLELPCAVPRIVLFNVVDNVIVGYNLLVLVVDKALELDAGWVLLSLGLVLTSFLR